MSGKQKEKWIVFAWISNKCGLTSSRSERNEKKNCVNDKCNDSFAFFLSSLLCWICVLCALLLSDMNVFFDYRDKNKFIDIFVLGPPPINTIFVNRYFWKIICKIIYMLISAVHFLPLTQIQLLQLNHIGDVMPPQKYTHTQSVHIYTIAQLFYLVYNLFC